MQLRSVLPWLLLVGCATLAASSARADEASGTWTGTLEGRANYFWERSTRVVVPEGEIKLAAPNGMRVGVHYLVDVISSASIGQGVTEDGVFTELRHGVGASLGKEIDLQSAQLDLSVHGTYSTENDYESLLYGLDTALSFDERNSKITLGVTRVSDDITSNSDPMWMGELDGFTVAGGYERVVNPIMTFGLTYQVAYLEGYLGNTYRVPQFDLGGVPGRENPPATRTRHNGAGRIAVTIPSSRTSFHLLYRAYLDSWDVAALTPELRVFQELGEHWLLRARYRFYTQTRASFAEQDGKYPGASSAHEGPTTNDPKLVAFTAHTLGLGVEYELGFLAGTFLDFAEDAVIDIAFDRYWTGTTFGDGIIGTAGGRLPF